MPSLLIIGAGGHGRVVADAALATGKWQVTASDRDAARCVGELLPGVACEPLSLSMQAANQVHVAIGQAAGREREVAALPAGVLASVVHPDASVSSSARIGDGCFVAAQAVVGPAAVLGVSVIVNHGAVVDHDVQVGDFTHIAALVALGGAARIGKRVLVGSGASVLPGVSIADDVVVGAGATVTADITTPGVYAGVPARRMK